MKTIGPLVSTFSIVGYDPAAPAWGIAIASKFLAVGARTCWGAPGRGVAVVQAYLNANNGRDAVTMLQAGAGAQEILDQLMARDAHAELRQMAVIDAQGQPASYTGSGCMDWAGSVIGERCAAQGNMLTGGEGCRAMVDHFERSSGTLARRLVDALALGEQLGGDQRGRQAAALFVVGQEPPDRFDVFTEPTIDLRVDDHADPCAELARLLDLYELVYCPSTADEQLPLTEVRVRQIQQILIQLGDYAGPVNGVVDGQLEAALQIVARRENLRKRFEFPLTWIDSRVIEHLDRLATRLSTL
ncbi:MAG: DUF1028 domain-containing protein [Caldilineaceae bacterium]